MPPELVETKPRIAPRIPMSSEEYFITMPTPNKTTKHPNGVRPFMKWVGGKTQLLPQLRKFYPANFKRYFEPFLGGGAVFFDVKPKEAFLNDINVTLINAYKHIQKTPEELIVLLRKLQNKYDRKPTEDRDAFYYEMRSKFNSLKDGSLEKTSLLIFLNKTGYNGMYRESATGGFNVPFGRYKNPTIFDESNIYAISDALKGTTLTSSSFEHAVINAKRGDFVYFDPPYYPLTGTAKFTNYHEKDFLEDEQLKLKEMFDALNKKGCFVMMSNSHTPFIGKLYGEYNKHIVMANRAINCKAAGRGKIKEYVITNY